MSFRLESVTLEGRNVPLWQPQSQQTAGSENTCTILIGRNGAGKSRLLAEVCRVFAAFDNEGRVPTDRPLFRTREMVRQPVAINYSAQGYAVELQSDGEVVTDLNVAGESCPIDVRPPLPRRVIATTITPSDKFPMERTQLRPGGDLAPLPQPGDRIYRYLGGKSGPDVHSTRHRLSRIADALVLASVKTRVARSRLADVFGLLGYHPRIALHYELRALREALRIVDLYEKDRDATLETAYRRVGPGPVRWSSIIEQLAHPELASQLQEALHHTLAVVGRSRRVTIDTNLESGDFDSGSFPLFYHLQLLTELRIAVLADFRLFRDPTHPESGELPLLNLDRPIHSLSVDNASSGEQAVLLTIFGVAGEIEDDSLIVIDEPEISLHPEWQEMIIPLMVSTFSGYHGCQFLIATHSPQVLARAAEAHSVVVTMDEKSASVWNAEDLAKKSADFQLATVFDTPGYRNEYLAREALAALQMVSLRRFDSREFADRIDVFRRARMRLQDDDPVAELIDAVLHASNVRGR